MSKSSNIFFTIYHHHTSIIIFSLPSFCLLFSVCPSWIQWVFWSPWGSSASAPWACSAWGVPWWSAAAWRRCPAGSRWSCRRWRSSAHHSWRSLSWQCGSPCGRSCRSWWCPPSPSLTQSTPWTYKLSQESQSDYQYCLLVFQRELTSLSWTSIDPTAPAVQWVLCSPCLFSISPHWLHPPWPHLQ